MNSTNISILKYCLLLLLLTLGALASCGQNYAIRNVSVITMENETVLERQNLLIENGQIKSMGLSVKVPSSYMQIDGSGKYIVPGLFDMHAHFFYEQGSHINYCEEELKLMLANGLTTVRIEGGHPAYLEARGNVANKKWTGPQLFVVSVPFVGKLYEQSPFEFYCDNAHDAEDAVRRFKVEGYDAIKITFLIKPEVYNAIIKTAKEVNIKVTGHVGPLVKLPAALEAKQQIEHMDEFIDMLLPDTSYNHGQSVSDMNVWRRKAWETVPYLDETKIPSLVKRVKDAGIFVTPTNYFFYSFFGMGIAEEKEKQKEDFQYVPPVLRDYAWEVRAKYWTNSPPEGSRMKYVNIRLALIKQLWQSGVPLMAGSDSPQWFLVTGFALHDELENLVLAGLTPYAALQTATINPATYLGVIKSKGTIQIGKQADFILLDENPLVDIKNTRSIRGVMIKGAWFDRTKLDRMLEEAKAKLNAD